MSSKKVKSMGDLVVSTKVLAEMFGLTERRIRQLVEEEVIDRASRGRYELVPTVKKYILYLKTYAAAKDQQIQQEQIEINHQHEKALHERAKREIAELNLAEMRGTMHKAEDVEAVMTDMLSAVRAKLLGLPTRVAPMLVARNEIAVIQDMLQREIYEALEELADYEPGLFRSDKYVESEDDGDEEVSGA